MGIIMEIMNDYENLIKTRITMPLDNEDIIKFLFNPQDLPHLLGIDIPVLFEYKNDRISASDLYKGMKNGIIDTEKFEESVYVYNSRIKYFSSKMLIDIIKARRLIMLA